MSFFATVTLALLLQDPGETLDRAYVLGDVAELSRVRNELEEGLDRKDTPFLRYRIAYACWRLASFEKRGSESGEKLLKAAEEQLEKLLKADPEDAEAHALYGTVQGNLITGMWSGMRRGPRADEAYRRAKELAPENPRVAMHEGVSRLFRPGFAGGGVEEAERDLLLALELFEKEPSETAWPNWGRAEIHGWLGYTMVEKKDFAEARAHYAKALAIEPDYHWVREVLLPALERQENPSMREILLLPELEDEKGPEELPVVADTLLVLAQ